MDHAAALGRTELFGNLAPDDLKELASLARLRELESGEILFFAGDPAAGLFVIVTGQIRAYRMNHQGREQTIHVERDGATLAEVPMFDDGAYPATAVAELPTKVLFLEKDDVRAFMLHHPQTCLVALKLMARRMRGHAELVDALALQQVGQRVARFLLDRCREQATRTDAGLLLALPLSNEELAGRIGSVREVVSRTVSRLESEGLISQQRGASGRIRQIVITDEAGLARYAQRGDSRE